MDLGIYILSYNRLDELKAVVQKLLALNQEDIREIYILDQGSTDGTRDYLGGLKGSVFQVIFSDKNLGVAGGRHRLMQESQADLCLFLDDDSYLVEDSIEKIKHRFCQDDLLDFISLNIIDVDGNRRDWPHSRSLKKQWLGSWPAMNFVGCGHVIRKESYFMVGGYSPTDMFYAEELDLAFKFYAYRKRITGKYCGDIKVVHLASQKSRLHWTGQRLVFRVKNRISYYLASFSLLSPLTWLFLFGFLFSDLVLALKNQNLNGFLSGLHSVKFTANSRCSMFSTVKYQILHIKYLLGYGI